MKIKEWLVDILWPKKCLGCGRNGTYICKDCEIFLSEASPEPVGRVVSVWEYEGLLEKLIQKIKHDGCYDIIDELVAVAFQKIELNLPEDTIITFVPMSKKKEKRRGFNQAELIANKVGEMTNRPVVKLLEKIKDNQSPVGLGPQERIKNVENTFVLLSKINPGTVLLVDDFYTTGATMKECINVLKSGGVKNVFGFTLARQSVVRAPLW